MVYSILAERKLGRVSAPQILVLSPVIRLEIGLGIFWVWSIRFLDRGCKELWDCSLQQKNSVRLVGKEWGQKETVGTYHRHSLLVKVPPAVCWRSISDLSPLASVSNTFGLLPPPHPPRPCFFPPPTCQACRKTLLTNVYRMLQRMIRLPNP